MAVSDVSAPAASESPGGDGCLQGQHILFVGKLSGMTRVEACQSVVAQGAVVVNDRSKSADLVIIGDEHASLDSVLRSETILSPQICAEISTGRTILWRESQLWHRLGLLNEEPGVKQLYTPAMLADLLEVPVAAIRRWHRSGALVACCSVRRLPYFNFAEVAAARHLADLLNAGCSLRVIDRKLNELDHCLPGVARPLCDPSLVVSGRRMYLRRGDDLAEPGGQLLIDFDKPDDAAQLKDQSEQLLSFSAADATTGAGEGVNPPDGENLSTLDLLQQEAMEWEDSGDLQQAAESYRTLLVAGGPTAEVHFALADLLYRMGDLSAARERYYAAVELDEEYVEARANLGSVLAENNELELAVAAFQGALAFHSDYADVHYHLANTLDRLGRREEAILHWQSFLALAPESPWANMARARLARESPEAQTAPTNAE